MSSALLLLQVAAVVVGVPLALRAARQGPGVAAVRGRLGPFTVWCVVVALVFVNQVLVVVFVGRVWGGDAGRITRYLPAGWFELPAPGGPLDALVAAFPAPGLLAPSVLRVDAVLELPFGVLAYLAIASRLDRRLAATLMRRDLLVVGCWATTLAFSCIEVRLATPYTLQDVLLRCATALVLPPLLRRFVRVDAGPSGPAGPRVGVVPLAAAVVWAVAFAALVLAVYATALLYDLARAPSELPSAVAALAVLGGAEVVLRRRGSSVPPPGLAVDAVGTGVRWFALLFFVPAVPLRYGLLFGSPFVTAAGAGVVAVVATAAAVREVAARHASHRRLWVAVAGSAAAGAAAALAARGVLPAWGGHTENRLLAVGAVLLLGTVLAAAAADRLVPSPAGVRTGRRGTPAAP